MRELLAGRLVAAQQRADAGGQLVDLERLDEVVVGAGVEARDALVEGVAGGQQQDRDAEALAAQPSGDREPVHARHRDVEHDHVRQRALDLGEGGAAVGRGGDVVALGGQRPLEHPPDRRVVVDEQDGGLGHHGESRAERAFAAPAGSPSSRRSAVTSATLMSNAGSGGPTQTVSTITRMGSTAARIGRDARGAA